CSVASGVCSVCCLFLMSRQPPRPTLLPYTTLFRSPGNPQREADARGRWRDAAAEVAHEVGRREHQQAGGGHAPPAPRAPAALVRSEEHTSELQSRVDLVCRLLLEKKKPRRQGNQAR